MEWHEVGDRIDLRNIDFSLDDPSKPLPYEAFDFMDRRKDDKEGYQPSGILKEKYQPKGDPKKLCQNQVFVFRSHLGKFHDKGDTTVGFKELCARVNVNDRDDLERTISSHEAKVMFRMFDFVMDLMQYQQEAFVVLLADILELHNARHTSAGVELRVPRTYSELKRKVTKGANSILKNFPAPWVFEIANHACVSLKEVIRIYAALGADYAFGWDAQTGQRNKDGLNGMTAMDRLIEKIQQKMRDSEIDESMILKTNIGHLVFWSDSFLRCFIKQKDNSVWILTVTVCPPEGMESSHMYSYILAIGKSSNDHTRVTEHFMEEARELMKGFEYYSFKTNQIERVAFGMLTWNAALQNENVSTLDLCKNSHFYKLNISFWTNSMSK